MCRIEQLYAEWQSLQPLKDEYQQRLNRKFMLEFNYNSNHLEGNTLTYGQTEALLLFGRVNESAKMKDLEDMKASNIALKMMEEQAKSEYPLTETFIRQLHKTLMREDYVEYRSLPDGTSWHYTVHAGIYKTRPNSVITPRKAVDMLVDKMEQYANFGFDYMQEKLEDNPNYFFKETAFLRVFLGFLNKENEEEDIDDVPESLD